jgi:hypothetical protein
MSTNKNMGREYWGGMEAEPGRGEIRGHRDSRKQQKKDGVDYE